MAIIDDNIVKRSLIFTQIFIYMVSYRDDMTEFHKRKVKLYIVSFVDMRKFSIHSVCA